MTQWSEEALRNRRAAQRRIKHRCTCGRLIFGNPGWWSHTHFADGAERPGHRFGGTT